MSKIRVMLVDDHAILREGIRAMLALHDEFEVVGEAANGAEAMEKMEVLQPDVVLMDIAMEKMNGLEATRLISQKYPRTSVLVLSQHDDRQYVLPLLQAGAAGYLLKRALGNVLIDAIRTVASGETYLDSSVRSVLFEEIRHQHVQGAKQANLTEREQDVLVLLVEGLSNSQIAERIHISENTVKKHLGSIQEKLHLNNRVEVAVYAVREGLVNLGDDLSKK